MSWKQDFRVRPSASSSNNHWSRSPHHLTLLNRGGSTRERKRSHQNVNDKCQGINISREGVRNCGPGYDHHKVRIGSVLVYSVTQADKCIGTSVPLEGTQWRSESYDHTSKRDTREWGEATSSSRVHSSPTMTHNRPRSIKYLSNV